MKIQSIHHQTGISPKSESKSVRPAERSAEPAFAERLKAAVQQRDRVAQKRLFAGELKVLKEQELANVLTDGEKNFIRKLYDTDDANLCYNGRCEPEKTVLLGRKIDLRV